AAGTAALGNTLAGVSIQNGASGNTIGGSATGAGNVISGNAGDGVDVSGGGTTGNVVAGNLVGTNAAGTAALGDPKGYDFSGGDVALHVPQLNTNTGGVTTVSFWMDWSGKQGTIPIGFGTYALGFFYGSQLAFTTSNGILADDQTTYLLNQWSFITAVFVDGDASQDQLWIDGVQQPLLPEYTGSSPLGQGTVTDTPYIGSDGYEVGQNQTGANFSGVLDDVAFFNDQLSPAQIQAEYTASIDGAYGATVLNQGAVAYYPLNETSGSTAFDASGNSHNGVVSASGVTLGVPGGPASNLGSGVFISGGASGNTIGGTTSGAGNVISGDNVNGVAIAGSGTTGNVVEGDYIGTDATGLVRVSNNGAGVLINNSAADNTIGGTASGGGDVISGNLGDGVAMSDGGTTGNVVEGDYIGVDAAGAAALANIGAGVQILPGVRGAVIGGTTAAARNVISGNRGDGVQIIGGPTSGNVVEGDYIGVDSTGEVDVPNLGSGVEIDNATDNTIGGPSAADRNVLSGNGDASDIYAYGVLIANGSGNVVENDYIGVDAAGVTALGNYRSGVDIGNSSANSVLDDLISGNGEAGVYIQGAASSGNVVAGDLIGTDYTGDVAVIPNVVAPNTTTAGDGVVIDGAPDNTIGGTTAGEQNVISGNSGDGVLIQDYYATGQATGNIVEGDYIGVNAAGTTALANGGAGVSIQSGAYANTIGGSAAGAGDVISGNVGDNVSISGAGANNNVVEGDTIGLNAAGTAALAGGTAYQFNGGQVAATIPQLDATDAGTATTVSFWMKWDGTDDEMPIAFSSQYDLQLAHGDFFFNTNNVDALGISSAGLAGQWVFVTAVFFNGSESQNQLWIDGVQQSLTVVSGTPAARNVSTSVTLGRGFSGLFPFTGELSDFAFFNQELTASQIQAEWGAHGTSSFRSTNLGQGPVAYYPFNETSGGTAFDISGNGNNGAISGAVTLGAAGSGAQISNGVDITAGAADNTIGGATAAARDVISGNSGDGVLVSGVGTTGNVIAGDYIGTSAAGTAAIGNGSEGVRFQGGATLNTVGGLTSAPGTGPGNVISGNADNGVFLQADDNSVLGNLIGTDATGTAAVGNDYGGLVVQGSYNTVGGTTATARNVISATRFVNNEFATNAGVLIYDAGYLTTAYNVVEDNYIGTDITGTIALGNAFSGVTVESPEAGSVGNVVADNLVSGNDGPLAYAGIFVNTSHDLTIEGNLVGVNAAGTAALPNPRGIWVYTPGDNITIGGASSTSNGALSGAGNLVSGNTRAGIEVDGGVDIYGNWIGTDITGMYAIPNSGDGVYVFGTGNEIGGTAAGTGNLISGNAGDGVDFSGAGTTGNLVPGNSIGVNSAGRPLTNSGYAVAIGAGTQANVAGAVTGDVYNAGVLSLGDPAVLSINGNYTQTSNGVLNIEIGGTNPATPDFDQLLVSGTATLNGTLNVSLINGFTPTVGESFEILTFGLRSGDFAVENGLYPYLTPQYHSNDLTLIGHAVVVNTNDSGTGSLRQAILDADAVVNADIIFDIPGTGPFAIAPQGALPAITSPMEIDGTSQPGFAGAPIIVLDGGSAGHANGLTVSAGGGGSTIQGLVIDDFSGSGIELDGGSDVVSGDWIGVGADGKTPKPNSYGVWVASPDDTVGGTTTAARNVLSGNTNAGVHLNGTAAYGNVVEGNYIGTDYTGAAPAANAYGVQLAQGAYDNTIGGVTAAARNIISGNTTAGVSVNDGPSIGTVVEGNYIGTDWTGMVALGNKDGVDVGNGTLIGGTATGAGNLISGNSQSGVLLFGGGDVIEGNLIGTDKTGDAALGNVTGITIFGTGNTIGGATAGAGNLISGNQGDEIVDFGGSTTIQGNFFDTNLSGTAALFASGALAIYLNNPGHDVIGGASAGAVGSMPVGVGSMPGETGAFAGNLIAAEVQIVGGTDNTVQGNFLGVNLAGTAVLANGGAIGDNGTGTLIGGSLPGQGNLISGGAGIALSGSGAAVEGNIIGTDITGTIPLGNAAGVTIFGTGNTIGGTTPGARNLIAANGYDWKGNPFSTQYGAGDLVLYGGGATKNVVEGNYFGLTPSGEATVGKTNFSIAIYQNASDNTIGGTTAGARNVISDVGGVVQVFGGASRNVLEGNYIGTDAAGAVTLNAQIVYVASSATDNTIGGTAAGAGNVVAGGVWIYNSGTTGNAVQGNLIGVGAGGAAALAGSIGVTVGAGASGNTIGGVTAAARNIISGSSRAGVTITDAGTSANVVEGNYIGTDGTGLAPLPNAGAGVLVESGATNNTVGGTAAGAGNLIAFNHGDGVDVDGAATTGDVIRINNIHDNTGLGIDLSNGGDDGQAAPSLTLFTSGNPTAVAGTLQAAANASYTIDFYAASPANAAGLGAEQSYIGSLTVTTNGSGAVSFSDATLFSTLPSQAVVAAAVAASGDTSEFSAPSSGGYTGTPPTVTIGGPTVTPANLPVAFTSSVGAGSGQTYTYAWSVTDATNPSFTLPASAVTDEPTFVFTPPTPGAYSVSLSVMDNLGGTAFSTSPLTVGDLGPAVAISGGTFNPAEESAVNLSSSILEPTGAVASMYDWIVTRNGQPYTLPPGTVVNASTFFFQPTEAGLYTVTLGVLDSAGGAAATTFSFLVGGPPTAAIFGAPSAVAVGTPLTLTNAVTNPSLSGPLTYTWTVDGPTGTTSTSNQTGFFTFTPTAAGSYSVSLHVSDNQGDSADAPPVVVQVLGVTQPQIVIPPVVNVQITGAPTTGLVGDSLSFGSNVTDPAGTTTAGYTWSVTLNGAPYNLPPGTVVDASTFQFRPAESGFYVVTLTAADSDGDVGSNSAIVSVASSDNTLAVAPTSPPTENTMATLGVQLNNGTSGATYTYNWNVIGLSYPYSASGSGTLSSSDTSSFDFTPSFPGQYQVSVTVSGPNGTTTTQTQIVTVAAVGFTPAIAGAPTTPVVEGSAVQLSATPNVPGGADGVLAYHWQVSGPDGYQADGADPNLDLTGQLPGVYTAVLTVTDAARTVETTTTTFTVAVTPSVQTAAATGNGDFSMTLAAPIPGASGVTYSWTVIDQTTGQTVSSSSTAAVTFSGPASDAYAVSLSVSINGVAQPATGDIVYIALPGATVTLPPVPAPIGEPVEVLTVALGNAKVDGSQVGLAQVQVALNGGDTLIGGSGPNMQFGDSGDNLLQGGVGPNTLVATGGDSLYGGGGPNSNLFLMTPGPSEYVTAGANANTLSFADSMTGVSVNLAQNAGQMQTIAGDATLNLTGAIQNLIGSAGPDLLFAADDSTVYGGGGNDTLVALGGSNILLEAGGAATVVQSAKSGANSITMFGGDGNDSLASSGGSDVTMIGGNGNATLSSSGGSSITMFGGDGNDSLYSSGGSSVSMIGGGGNTTLSAS
ncbi:MAG TPA: PKD domain-containing protein, partial [Gemmataceae bacterium]|nr:PKD domain-containing protein [Gemmataceae bacterium]